MAAQAPRQVARDERILAVPKIAEGAQAQEEKLKQELQQKIVDTINEKIELARRQRPDIPAIDRSNFSLTVPNSEVAVVQSAGFIFTENTRDRTTSIYGKDSKIVIS